MKLFDRIERNALFIILEGIAFIAAFNLYNPYVQMFAKRMGAHDLHVGLINSIPPLVAIFVLIPFSILIERAGNKKYVTGLMIFINSLFYAVIAWVPFLPDQVKIWVYILLIGLMNWPGSLYTTTWQSFFADTFHGPTATRVYSLRSKYSAVFGLVVALLAGLVLTGLPGNESQRIHFYQAFYLACFVISLVQLLFLSKVRPLPPGRNLDPDCNGARCDRPAAASEEAVAVRTTFRDFFQVFSNRKFVIFCGTAFLFHLTWQMGWPIFFLYNTEVAGLNEFQLGLISVSSGLASFLSYSLWNRLIEKKGTGFAIIPGALGIAANTFFYTGLIDLYAIMLLNILVGASCAGFTLALFGTLLEALPENRKTVYLAVYNTFINVSGFIAPLIGVWMNRYTGMFKAFLIIGFLRVSAAALFIIRWAWTRKYTVDRSGSSSGAAA